MFSKHFGSSCFLRIIVGWKRTLLIERMCLPSGDATESMKLPREQQSTCQLASHVYIGSFLRSVLHPLDTGMFSHLWGLLLARILLSFLCYCNTICVWVLILALYYWKLHKIQYALLHFETSPESNKHS